MAPTLVRAPFHRHGWLYEEKVDGYRMLAYKERTAVRLISRTGVDHTRRYPDIVADVARLGTSTLVIDAELTVFDEQLRSRFEWLRHRQLGERASPPLLIAFDLVYTRAVTSAGGPCGNDVRASSTSSPTRHSSSQRGGWPGTA